MRCPKCRTEEMARESHGGVEVERCPTCRGLWLDRGELEALLERRLGGVADTLAFSPLSDAMDLLAGHCERWDREMVPSFGPEDVRVDRCEGCGAVFLDEGELASLALQAT